MRAVESGGKFWPDHSSRRVGSGVSTELELGLELDLRLRRAGEQASSWVRLVGGMGEM